MSFEALPNPLPGMRAWAASAAGYSFVITHEDGTNLRTSADRAAWVGYTASVKPLGGFVGTIQPPTRIDGLWQSFAAAEKACRDTLRQLRRKS